MRLIPLAILLISLSLPIQKASADEPFPIPAKSKKGSVATSDESSEGSDIGRPRRRASRNVGYVGIGPAFMSNMVADGTGMLAAGTYGWDLNEAIIKLNGELAINGSATWASVGVGVQGFLYSGEHVPYVAADFGLTYARSQSTSPVPRTATGFSVGAQAGIQLFRTANVQFDAGLRYAVVLKENASGHPSLVTLRVGIWF